MAGGDLEPMAASDGLFASGDGDQSAARSLLSAAKPG